ncbi:helix-turn-helix domain-containing protein [Roseivirga sp.]|uniref:helix-turn-helix domain-containing protein n=1 Tax=Roseivirga sp. TaxID=1964215 RepID=UPI003B8CD428
MNRLKDIRITKGLSQEGLATISGVSLRTIQRIENEEAEPRIQTLQTLAKSLEVEIELLTKVPSGVSSNFNDKIPHKKYALINGIAYLIFPISAMIISWITYKTQENNEVKKYFSSLIGLDIIAFTINIMIPQFFKLEGWSGGLEIAIILHVAFFLLILGSGFILRKSTAIKA